MAVLGYDLAADVSVLLQLVKRQLTFTAERERDPLTAPAAINCLDQVTQSLPGPHQSSEEFLLSVRYRADGTTAQLPAPRVPT